MRPVKKKNIFICFLLIVAIAALFSLAGCGGSDDEEHQYYIYYIDDEDTKILSEPYEPYSSNTEGLISEFIDKLSEDTNSVEYHCVLDDVQIEYFTLEDGYVSVYFNNDYNDLSPDREVLLRGAVVHAIMQVEGVEGITFYVDGASLLDGEGMEVGIMTNDSFVENPGETINSIQDISLTLYFASLSGDFLVGETQHVYYSSNISTEKLILERLLVGPKSENAQATIPEDTSLISVSVMDGVCFVNLDEQFMTQNYEITEDVVIYSIVDSLTELDTIDTVQISINGETNMIYREKLSLTEYFTRDTSLISGQTEGDVEINQEEVIDTKE